MSSRLPESCAQKDRFFNCRDQLCVNLDTGELIRLNSYTGNHLGSVKDQHLDGKFMGICKIEKARTGMLAVYFG